MVDEAQSHSAEDKRRREEVEARNSADAVAYQVEKQIQELAERVPINDKARAKQLIGEIESWSELVHRMWVDCDNSLATSNKRPLVFQRLLIVRPKEPVRVRTQIRAAALKTR